MGTNFRSVAKALVTRQPEWGFVLADLRGHGASQGFAAPHTLATAAGDVEALAAALNLRIDGIAGHSFGGKVCLELLSRPGEEIDLALILDSMPGARASTEELGDPMRVLATLEAIPFPLQSRDEFRERLMAAGYSVALTDWLTMNVRLLGTEYFLRLDLPAIRSLLADYFAKDLWGALSLPSRAREVSLIVGGRSPVFDETARSRLVSASAADSHLSVTFLENAGHWLHVDDPLGLSDAMYAAMRRVSERRRL